MKKFFTPGFFKFLFAFAALIVASFVIITLAGKG